MDKVNLSRFHGANLFAQADRAVANVDARYQSCKLDPRMSLR